MAPSSNAATFALFAAMCIVFTSFAVPAHAADIASTQKYRDCIDDLPGCTVLYLKSTALTGTVPSELGRLTALTDLCALCPAY
ncbi:hypothetical protein T492DRAFT_920752 [Pavlovales sp. CCMP2436]|nr:hypothetical protein T492DRAFT_920752 [Pavlovales sp. CCMP2436]|mmetsp:Transcript_24586/g.62223  ORF Transcript_24586/g.62223 Transcript_24586/m.62223 type:complete len:83 (-) Transcript_24586:4-252(-)